MKRFSRFLRFKRTFQRLIANATSRFGLFVASPLTLVVAVSSSLPSLAATSHVLFSRSNSGELGRYATAAIRCCVA